MPRTSNAPSPPSAPWGIRLGRSEVCAAKSGLKFDSASLSRAFPAGDIASSPRSRTSSRGSPDRLGRGFGAIPTRIFNASVRRMPPTSMWTQGCKPLSPTSCSLLRFLRKMNAAPKEAATTTVQTRTYISGLSLENFGKTGMPISESKSNTGGFFPIHAKVPTVNAEKAAHPAMTARLRITNALTGDAFTSEYFSKRTVFIRMTSPGDIHPQIPTQIAEKSPS